MSETPNSLLTHETGNQKIAKKNYDTSNGLWLPSIIHLSPYTKGGRGNVCQFATVGKRGCAAPCLDTSGHGGIGNPKTNTVQLARKRRTKFWFDHPREFIAMAVKEIGARIRKAEKLPDYQGVAIRPNGTSDLLDMAEILIDACDNHYPGANLIFYDYTKRPWDFAKHCGWVRPNYHLTFSWSGSDVNALACIDALRNGCNVAAMHEAKGRHRHDKNWKPGDVALITGVRPSDSRLEGIRTFDADAHDLRFLDQLDWEDESLNYGRIGVLKPKGKAKNSSWPGFAGQWVRHANRRLVSDPEFSLALTPRELVHGNRLTPLSR